MRFDSLAHWLLRRLDAETAHEIGKEAMKHKWRAPGKFQCPDTETELFGCKLDNPLGLAAGFDKNGELVDAARDYGFAYVEVGSITWEGGKGNPRPRMFRLEDGCLLNRMGLNGEPAKVVVERLKSAGTPYAVNIAKTHNPNIMGDKAIDDVVRTYELVVRELENTGQVIYVVLNLSCPNTAEGKTFEEPEPLQELLSAVKDCNGKRPYLVKLSPTLQRKQIEALIEVADDEVAGYVCCNTRAFNHFKYGKGGQSGPLVKELTKRVIQEVRSLSDKLIIGLGGIQTGRDAYQLMQAGADIVQAYTGFVYGGQYSGVGFAHKVNEGL